MNQTCHFKSLKFRLVVMLPNSVGKTFSVAVKVWLLENEKERKSGEYHYNTLLIQSDNEIVFDSFLIIKEGNYIHF